YSHTTGQSPVDIGNCAVDEAITAVSHGDLTIVPNMMSQTKSSDKGETTTDKLMPTVKRRLKT
ncbi:hypothetical protein chiPu_0027564, partial [Chiloscyllium punctatum]|nr:hypothetical protein [Chiloscyllium punctatum]